MTAKPSKCVAYVSTYTNSTHDSTGFGLHVYDVDLQSGLFSPKDRYYISNVSYFCTAHNRHNLYAITDNGVRSFAIKHDGRLEMTSQASINGMRGCYLSLDYTDSYLFVSGYHDGKLTVLRVDENGELDEICEEIFHKSLGSAAERNNRPHISCAKMSRDNKFLLTADVGLDRTDVYRFNASNGKLHLEDVLHSAQDSGPRHIKFSRDGRFFYIMHEMKNYIDVYSYGVDAKDRPNFEKIQTVPVLSDSHILYSASSSLELSANGNYLTVSTSGKNTVSLFRISHETGLLERSFCLPISGEFPKDALLYPDNRHLVSLNHESGTMTFFKVEHGNLETNGYGSRTDAEGFVKNGHLVMFAKELTLDQPNHIIFHDL